MTDSRYLKESTSPVEALRIEKTNMNQEAFAKACGIPLRTYGRWIRGETKPAPTIKQIKQICEVLGIVYAKDIPEFRPKDKQ